MHPNMALKSWETFIWSRVYSTQLPNITEFVALSDDFKFENLKTCVWIPLILLKLKNY